jgi:hypothetical protein
MRKSLLIAALLLVVLVGVGFFVWTTQMREIRLCRAVRSFHAQNGRPPSALDELPEDARQLTTSPDGTPYHFGCDGQPPECSLSWTEDGHSVGRNCGLREPGSLTNWF